MVRVVAPEHHENAATPNEITPLGIVMSLKPVQYENAQRPMAVTLLGIVKVIKFVQLKKAFSPIDVTPPSIVIDLIESTNDFQGMFNSLV
jgi:hypothetical protein